MKQDKINLAKQMDADLLLQEKVMKKIEAEKSEELA